MTALDDMVVQSLTNPDNAVSQNAGLAIYFPSESETNPEDLEEYSLLSCNTDSAENRKAGLGANLSNGKSSRVVAQQVNGVMGVTR